MGRTATVKKAKPKASASQQYIDPEMAPKTVPEIEAQASLYIDARDGQADMKEQENSAKEALIALMQKHKLDEYMFGPDERRYKIVLQDETHVKFKKVKLADRELAMSITAILLFAIGTNYFCFLWGWYMATAHCDKRDERQRISPFSDN